MAAAAAVQGDRDPLALRAAQILVGLRSRKLRERPEWLPAPAGEASSSSPGTVPAEEEPERWATRLPRSRGRRGSCLPWRKVLREPRGLAGSGGEEERDAAPARRPVEATLCCGAAAGSGPPSTSSADRLPRTRTQPRPHHADEKAAAQARAAVALAAAPAAKEPVKESSPDTPLDFGAGGSRASSSADDAAQPRARRKAPGARGSGGGVGDDDEGCSSPAKRPRVATDEEKPILLPTEQSIQIEARASSTKVLAFDLNLPPPSDDGACPDAC